MFAFCFISPLCPSAAAAAVQVYVQSVAVDDMISVLTRDTAPKRMRVWGFPETRGSYAPPPPFSSSNNSSSSNSISELSLEKVLPVDSSSSSSSWLQSTLSVLWRHPRGTAAAAATAAPPVLLGEFLLEQGSKSSRFEVYPQQQQQQQQPIKKIMFEFIENFGNSKYTCVYRLRVHGSKAVLLTPSSSSSSSK